MDKTVLTEDAPKKKGRPRKTETPIKNESVEKIIFEQNELSIEKCQQRWQTALQKYRGLGYDEVWGSWKNANAFGLNNPFTQNMRVKRTIASPLMDISKEDLQKALDNPSESELMLQSASVGLYYNNFIYQTVVQLYRDIPRFCAYATPLYIEGSDSKKVKEDAQLVDKILKSFDVRRTAKTIATHCALEGKASYLVRLSSTKKDVNYILLQKLDTSQVKVTSFGSKQKFIVSFNMSIFLQAGYSPDQYPKWIQDAWEEMITTGVVVEDKKGKKKINPKANIPDGHMLESGVDGSYFYWIQCPQDLVWTFSADESTPVALSPFIGLIPDINSLDDYKWLQSQVASSTINSILTFQVPTVKDARAGSDATIISPDVIMGYTNLFNQTVGGNILPFISPFTDAKLHTVSQQPEKAMEIVYDRINQILATSSLSGLITLSDKPSIASVQAAQKIWESRTEGTALQIQNFLNKVINDNFDLNYDWNITVHGGIFTWREDAKTVKELVLQGASGLLPRLLSYYDMSLEDYKGDQAYMKALGIKLDTEVMEENKLKAQAAGKNPVGRPSLSPDEVTNENTGASKDAGNNVSTTKMSARCMKCGAELGEGEEIICPTCLEIMYEERS